MCSCPLPSSSARSLRSGSAAIWELAGNRLYLALAFLRIAYHRYQSATTRTGRDIAFAAYLFVHTRRASARHRDQWPQGSLRGARALRTAPFLQGLGGMVLHISSTAQGKMVR